jgi:hypothetical protein
MPVGVGHVTKTNVFMEVDAAWGTRVATGGTQIECDTVGINLDQGSLESKALYGGLSPRYISQLGNKATGRMSGEFRIEGMSKILALITGERPTYANTLVTVDTGIYHIAKTAQISKPAVSLEYVEAGVVKASGDCALVLGLIATRGKFSLAGSMGDDAVLRWEVDVVGKSKTPQTTAQLTAIGANLAAAHVSPFNFGDSLSASFLDGADNTGVTGVEIEINTPMKTDRFHISAGSRQMQQPLWNGQASVLWTVRREFSTYANLDAAQNWTDGNLKMKLAQGVIAGSTGSIPYSVTFETKLAKVIGPPDVNVNDFGVIEEVTRWKAYHDTTQVGGIENGPLLITIQQTKDTLVTPGS